MESITGPKIDYDGVGALRGQWQLPQTLTQVTPPPTPQGMVYEVVSFYFIVEKILRKNVAN